VVADRQQSTEPASAAQTRFDRRLTAILAHAAEVFCEKGYEGASMRDLSRASGMSLSGLYHYFESKEKLLYLIQKHTFSTIMDSVLARLEGVRSPEERIRTFILNHLEYFLAHQQAMKVLSHEDDVLQNALGAEVAALKREYYRILLGLLDDLKRSHKLDFSSRLATLSLFGMMNWIYTWYQPRVDADAAQLARHMGDLFLHGICAAPRTSRNPRRKAAGSK
jgi:AcrR family transcriptional regulator